MSELSNVAGQVAQICLSAVSYATGASTGIGAFVVPLTVLAAIGASPRLERRARCADRARSAALDALKAVPEFGAADFDRALALLADGGARARIDPHALSAASRAGAAGFRDELARRLLEPIPFQLDDALPRRLVLLAVEASLDCLLADPDMRQDLDRHLLLDAARDHGLELALLGRIEERQAAEAERAEARHREQMDLLRRLAASGALTAEARRLTREQEDFVLAVAERYVGGTASDPDTALRGIAAALEEAARMRAAPPSDLGGAVGQVFHRVEALNEARRIDEASATLRAAVEARKARLAEEEAALDALVERAIGQARVANAPGEAAAYVAERVEHAGGPDRFARLRAAQGEWFARGRDRGLAFDLEVAVALARDCLARARDAGERGAAAHDLATALAMLGKWEAGAARLLEAVAVFRAALADRPRERVPLLWALTQNNLGNALLDLGEREPGTARLLEAVDAYRAALEERTRERAPLDWAQTQNNLGAALATLGEREPGTARIEEAADAYRAALAERTRERVPLDWAQTQTNLGVTLATWGEREAGTARLLEAVDAFRAGLGEHTRERVPLEWAWTQAFLGNALRTLGEREGDAAQILEAVGAYRAALEEWTRERVPLDWAATTLNLAAAEVALFGRTAAAGHLDAAEALAREARAVFAEAAAGHQVEMADRALARIAALRPTPGVPPPSPVDSPFLSAIVAPEPGE